MADLMAKELTDDTTVIEVKKFDLSLRGLAMFLNYPILILRFQNDDYIAKNKN